MGAGTSRRAFTLIELLVVIAIIALLLAMLVPMLQRAKEITRRALCASNMRSIGQAAWVFAAERGGRGPGIAYRSPDWSGISWYNILNQEYFKSGRIITRWSEVSGEELRSSRPKNRLCCPSMMKWANLLSVTYEWSSTAANGKDIEVAEVQYLWSTQLASYKLGAMLDAFPEPSHKFLMVESESSNTYFLCCKKSPPYGVRVATYGNVPSWAGEYGGAWAFRHVLPHDVRLYQTQATGNFLFVDCHVETLTPNANIQAVDRTSLAP